MIRYQAVVAGLASGNLKENDILIFLGFQTDSLHLFLWDVHGHVDHFASVSVDQIPVHERFHIANVFNPWEEICNDQTATRAQ